MLRIIISGLDIFNTGFSVLSLVRLMENDTDVYILIYLHAYLVSNQLFVCVGEDGDTVLGCPAIAQLRVALAGWRRCFALHSACSFLPLDPSD